MKLENLIKAHQGAWFVLNDIRSAHTDAVKSGNQFAEIALFDLIEDAVKLEQKLKRLEDAASNLKS